MIDKNSFYMNLVLMILSLTEGKGFSGGRGSSGGGYKGGSRGSGTYGGASNYGTMNKP